MNRSAGLLLAARVTSAATTLAVLALTSRLRGADALGAVAIGFALGAIGSAISDLGLSTLLVRQASRNVADAAHLLGAGLAIRVITVPLVSVVAAAISIAVAPALWLVAVLAALGLVVQQVAELTRSVFMARQRMGIVAGHTIIENVAWLGAIAGSLFVGQALEFVMLGALAVLLASVGVGLILTFRLVGVLPRLPRPAELRATIELALPFAGFAIVALMTSRLDPLLIGLLVGGPALAAAGSYFAASRLIGAFDYLPEAVSRALYPEMAVRALGNPASVVRLLGNASSALLVTAIAVPVALIPSADWIMGLLLGTEAARNGWILAGLSLVVPIRALAYLLGITLTSVDSQARRLAASAAALVIAATVGVIGIPRVGLIAPVISAIAGAAVTSGLYAAFVRRHFGGTGLGPRAFLAPLVAGSVALLIGIAARLVVPDPLAAAAGTLAYGGLILVRIRWLADRRVEGQPA